MGNKSPANQLKPGFSRLGMWAFSIGTSIGWGSFIVTCNTYLLKSGILSTVFGLLMGMAVILVITWNLQYMIRSAPGAGGIYTFEKRVGGKDLGFLAFWFVLLTYLAILWANITSVPLFVRFFLGDTFRFGFHYKIFGYEVWFGEALLSILTILLVALLCAKSAGAPKHIMTAGALLFVSGFTVCAVMAVVRHDSAFSYEPLYADNSGAFSQIVRIAAISPWAFIGFENIAHFSEEYRFKVKKVRSILISSVIVTTVLYIAVALLSVSAYPPEYESWFAYLKDMGNLSGIKAVPAFYAASHYLGKAGVGVLMVSLFAVIITSLLGNMLALSRLLFAAGREGDAPRKLGVLNHKGIPQNAIYAVAAVSLIIPFLGRTAIGWIVDVTTLGATLIYGLIAQAVFQHARKEHRRAEQVTGAVGILLMTCFMVLLLIPGLLPFHAMETESYILFIVWSVLGLVYFRILVRRDENHGSKHRVIVWVLLLLLVLIASMMWVSRETETAAENAVTQIYEYHESHPDIGSAQAEAERAAFLNRQAEAISRTNTLYTVVSLALFMIAIAILLNNYQDTRRLGKNLQVARERASRDALTGVKNQYAFSQAEKALNERIETEEEPAFAIVVCDINDLKIVNDTKGHKVGDTYICRVCDVICSVFRNSTVFRIGGDEFVVICEGEDYENIEALLEEMSEAIHLAENNVHFAYGCARFAQEMSAQEVFVKADRRMYELKDHMKAIEEKSAGESGLYQFPENFKKAYESSAISFVYYQNIEGKAEPILVSDGFCRNIGMRRESALSWLKTGMFERMHPDDVGLVSQISDAFLHKRGEYDVVFRCQIGTADAIAAMGAEKYVYIHGLGKWQTMPNGTTLALITYANLSATQHSATEQMETYALQHKDVFYTDPLTELPNMNYLHEFGNEKVNVVRAAGKIPYVVYLDIYGMQSYNAHYGYKEGDKLLCLVAETLKAQLPDAFVARASDDHFVIITQVGKASHLQKRLHKANKIIRKSAYGNTSGARFGVYVMEESRSEFVDALDCAKQALKHIENDMNREVAFFSLEKSERYLRDLYILEHLDEAIEQGHIRVHYHGLYRMASGKVAAFEALARWYDPEYGKIYPDEFIGVLLKYHQLYKLDLFMFEQVCREVLIRHEHGLSHVPVSVNFSRQDFDHFDVVEEMNRLFEKYELDKYIDKSYFIVEITEQDLALGQDNLREQLRAIRANGYRLWMDDFGSGYSSLNVFSQFEFDLIKYDMDLLRCLDDNGGVNRVILREFTRVAQGLRIQTLIEGVETQEQYDFVKEIGCELAQGFYFHKPETLNAVVEEIGTGTFGSEFESAEERNELNKNWRNK